MNSTYALPAGGEQRGDEYYLPCPNPCCPSHDKGRRNKFSYNVRREIGHCFVCAYNVVGRSSLLRLYDTGTVAPRSYQPGKARHSSVASMGPATHCAAVRDYLQSRGVSDDVAALCGAVAVPPDRVGFPVHPMAGAITQPMLMTRALGESGHWRSFPAGKRNYVFGCYPLTPVKHYVLVEGIFDVLSPGLYYPGVIAVLGKAVGDEIQDRLLNAGAESINIWFDNDDPGRSGARALAQALETRKRVMQRAGAGPLPTVSVIASDHYTDPGSYPPDHPFVVDVRRLVTQSC